MGDTPVSVSFFLMELTMSLGTDIATHVILDVLKDVFFGGKK
jgi:hypothetical protein